MLVFFAIASPSFAANAAVAIIGRCHLIQEFSQAMARVLRLRHRLVVVYRVT